MKRLAMISVVLGMTACHDDPQTVIPVQPTVQGQLNYQDEQGLPLGQLRGDDVDELVLIADNNDPISDFEIRLKQPFAGTSKRLALAASFYSQDKILQFKPIISDPLVATYIMQNIDGKTGGVCEAFISQSPYELQCIDGRAQLFIDSSNGQVKWQQDQAKVLAVSGSNTATVDPIALDPSSQPQITESVASVIASVIEATGSLTSKISPNALVFKEKRFPEQIVESQLTLDSIPFSLKQADYPKQEDKYDASGQLILKQNLLILADATKFQFLFLDLESHKILTLIGDYQGSLYFYNCTASCDYQMIERQGVIEFVVNHAVVGYDDRQKVLTGTVKFKPHVSTLTFNQFKFNADQINVTTTAENNRAVYQFDQFSAVGDTQCQAQRKIKVVRENQQILSIELHCINNLDDQSEGQIVGACGIPNTPACLGASVSTDQQTFRFLQTSLSNNEKISGTLYFAGVATSH